MPAPPPRRRAPGACRGERPTVTAPWRLRPSGSRELRLQWVLYAAAIGPASAVAPPTGYARRARGPPAGRIVVPVRDAPGRRVGPFFLLVTALALPLWAIGALVGGELMPGLPLAALQFVVPVIAASLLVYRREGG